MWKALAVVAAGLATVTPVLADHSYTVDDVFDAQCADFAETLRQTYDNASIWFTESVAAGTNLSLPDYDPTCGDQYQEVSVDMCRVAMFVPTSDRSNISSMYFSSPDIHHGFAFSC